MANEIIPFGKHKGQPIEVLASDKEYLEWLTAQSWFKSRYLNLYNIVINNFREPADTPEHNKMQIKFLKPQHRLKLAYLMMPNLFTNNLEVVKKNIDAHLQSKGSNTAGFFIDRIKQESQLLNLPDPKFEPVDVLYSVSYGIFIDESVAGISIQFDSAVYGSIEVEIKPTISDDFPAVLRQMKASMPVTKSRYPQYYILLIGSYTGVGASQEEFIQYFQTQGYNVVFEHEIDAVILPEFETIFKIG